MSLVIGVWPMPSAKAFMVAGRQAAFRRSPQGAARRSTFRYGGDYCVWLILKSAASGRFLLAVVAVK